MFTLPMLIFLASHISYLIHNKDLRRRPDNALSLKPKLTFWSSPRSQWVGDELEGVDIIDAFRVSFLFF